MNQHNHTASAGTCYASSVMQKLNSACRVHQLLRCSCWDARCETTGLQDSWQTRTLRLMLNDHARFKRDRDLAACIRSCDHRFEEVAMHLCGNGSLVGMNGGHDQPQALSNLLCWRFPT